MTAWNFTKGLHDLGNGVFAYLQPDGGWGWSNAGLIVDGDQSLLVDTLFDMTLTHEMLDIMRDATGLTGDRIGTIVNTHANGDHTFGNGCCPHAEIIASEASTREMEEFGAKDLAALLRQAGHMGEAGKYLTDIFGPFDFDHVHERQPTQTFSGEMAVSVGDKRLQLIEVGPAHTAGDILVHVPEDRTVFTGDILFIEGTPIMWAGPIGNWIKACDRIIAMDVDKIIPGHGPITDKAGVRRMQDYLKFCDREVRQRFDAGLSVRDAAHDIALGDFSSWGDSERIAVNVDTLYREYRGDKGGPEDVVGLFALMAELRR